MNIRRSKLRAKFIPFLASAILMGLMPLHVFATDNTDFYSQNDILFYDENATGCSPESSIPGMNVVMNGVDASAIATASDYSVIKAAGYSFMGRYLEIPGGGKPYFLTTTELDAAKQAGVDIFLIYEWNDTNSDHFPNSFAHGARDAQIALDALTSLGLPNTTPVYYSLDRGYQSSSNATLYATLDQEIDYFKGINSVINNTDAIGAYASKEELLALKEQDLIGWLWHAKWKDQLDSVGWGAHMYQLTIDPGGLPLVVDQDFAYSTNIGQIGGSASPTITTTSAATGDVKQREETILRFFTGKGFTLGAAAGITGNAKRESDGTYDPRIMYGGKMATTESQALATASFGIFQWAGSRTQSLINYAHSIGKSIFDIQVQLDFAWLEASGYDEKGVKVGSGYTKMLSMLNSVKTNEPYGIDDPALAAAIMWHGVPASMLKDGNKYVNAVGEVYGFERSADNADGVVNGRGKYAVEILAAYKGQIPDGTGVVGAGTTTPNSLANIGCNTAPGALNGDIVSTAILFAQPQPVTHGQSQPSDAKPEFVDAIAKYNPGASTADCGNFVGTVMRASGADPSYPGGGTDAQKDWVLSHPDKYQIILAPKVSDLAPGDIVIIVNSVGNHHTFIYTGGSPYPFADAALDSSNPANGRVPSMRPASELTLYLGWPDAIAARLIK